MRQARNTSIESQPALVINEPVSISACSLPLFYNEWKSITKDEFVLEIVRGY